MGIWPNISLSARNHWREVPTLVSGGPRSERSDNRGFGSGTASLVMHRVETGRMLRKKDISCRPRSDAVYDSIFRLVLSGGICTRGGVVA